MSRFILLSLFLACWVISSVAQETLNIAFLVDEEQQGEGFLQPEIETEIEALLSSRLDISFTTVLARSENYPQQITEAYQQSDLLIGMGLTACGYLASIEEYAKPTILTIVLDNELQNIPLTSNNTSGKNNLTYVQSPFDFTRDFATLYAIKPYTKLGLLTEGNTLESQFDFLSFLKKRLPSEEITFEAITISNRNNEDILQNIPEEVDAIFAFPLLNDIAPETVMQLFNGLARKGLPVFSLLSTPMMDYGAYAAYDTDNNLKRVPRRVAIDVLKIVEGTPAADINVKMDNYAEDLLINMQTVNLSGHYPNWDILSNAILLNITAPENDARKMTLYSAVAEALQRNLELQIAQKEVNISDKEVRIARSNYLPQVDASATVLGIDDNTVRNSFGTRGRLNLSATATLSQLILSEPAIANIAIQRFLLESQKMALQQNELDVVLDISNAYLGILQANELVRLRNENVNVTRKNYNIAKAKEQVGYAGTSDVYRWESELALDNIDLNNALAQLKQTRFNLNMLLNRPIKESFELADVGITDSILYVLDDRLFPLINNPGDIEHFADFEVQEAFNNLPEIKQIEAALAAQERGLRSQNRAFYLPQVAFSAQYDYPIDQSGYPEGVMPAEVKPTYNAAIGVQLPIFQGQARRYQQEQSEVGILQLKDQQADLRNKLELQVRANLEIAGASFSNLELSQAAVNASRKNFEVAQNAYQQGILNITSLIDAQNALLQTEINAINAEYTFISNFLAVERAVGYYHFLSSPQEKTAFFQRFVQYITNK